MRANQLEDVIPGLREARDQERQNRALAFSDIPWAACGLDVVVLTPRHRLELQLIRNAFAVGGAVTKSGLCLFLWRLNPHFTKKVWFGSAAWRARRQVDRVVAAADLDQARTEIIVYLGAMLQDLPEGGDGGDTSNPPENYVHWLACELCFYLKRFPSLTREAFMDTPYLVLQQLYRAHRLEMDKHPHFINASDRLIGEFMRSQRKELHGHS